MRRAVRAWLVASIVFAAASMPARGSGSDATSFGSVSVRPGGGVLTFFFDPSGSEETLLELKKRLAREGAFHMNLFSPRWLVCKIPRGVQAERIAAELGVMVLDEEEAGSAEWKGTGAGMLLEGYRSARGRPSSGSRDRVEPLDAIAFDVAIDTVLMLPPAAPPVGAGGAPGGEDRRADQNSEFLLGDIVVNLVFPESDGGSEDWSDAELSDAVRGAYAAMLSYQEKYGYAPMNFVFRSFRKVNTIYEPIDHNGDDDYLWIRDCMNTLGFGQPRGDVFSEVHTFNEYYRKRYGADWVFTAFIANADNDADHLFKGARYTAYAYLGGPYLVIPYPAGSYNPNNLEQWVLFSQIFQHEVCHIFWALDEYASALGDCQGHSGYLNYYNRNKILSVDLYGQPMGCQEITSCIMANARGTGRPICRYTAGMIGVIDADGNSIADVFDAPPRIEFENSAVETVTASSYTLRCRALSVPVQNRNPYFEDKPWKRSYAPPLKSGIIDINLSGNIFIAPDDGRWDEEEEEITFRLSGIPTGLTTIGVTVRNSVGASSGRYEKRIYNLGLTFSPFEIAVYDGKIMLSWSVIGETFGARFDLYRIDASGGSSDTLLLATDLEPSGPRDGVYVPYTFIDEDVEPGMTYRYFVRGTFVVSGDRRFESRSPVAAATAMLPVPPGELVSLPSPNPFRGEVRFSIIVPSTYEETMPGEGNHPGGPTRTPAVRIEVPTPVEAVVYDVAGRRVRTVYSNRVFSQVVTVGWDGVDERGNPAPSGMYFLRVRAGDLVESRKILLLR